MDINERGPASPEEYENARMAAMFAMTNHDLANAIDTAARHSESRFGPGKRENMMLDHLQKLLELQLRRAAIVRISEADTKTPRGGPLTPFNPTNAASNQLKTPNA